MYYILYSIHAKEKSHKILYLFLAGYLEVVLDPTI